MKFSFRDCVRPYAGRGYAGIVVKVFEELVRLCGPQLAESNIRSVLEWTTIVIVIVDCYLTCITTYLVCNICGA